ncbi:uncharacterized protein JCM6883_003155, partial [Sporobolomyces salmoneus]|uniref:uncharacterized protein n=1 Tax=Sporobolomyces salmoneus TaxID=183962 RepID=UPI0031735E7F
YVEKVTEVEKRVEQLKEGLESDRKSKIDRLESQIKQSSLDPLKEPRRRNHLHLARPLWPSLPTLEEEEEEEEENNEGEREGGSARESRGQSEEGDLATGGTGEDEPMGDVEEAGAGNEEASQSGAEPHQEKLRKRTAEEKMKTKDGKGLPFQRMLVPQFDGYKEAALQKINGDTLTPPTEKPLPSPQYGQKKMDLADRNVKWTTRHRHSSGAYRELIIDDSQTHSPEKQQELRRAEIRVEEAIRLVGTQEAAAHPRSFLLALETAATTRPAVLTLLGLGKRQDVADAVVKAARERAKDWSDKDEIIPPKEVRLAYLYQRAAKEDQEATQEVYTAPNVEHRLDPVLSHFVTTWILAMEQRTAGLKPVFSLIASILTSPDSTLDKVEAFTNSIFPNLTSPLPSLEKPLPGAARLLSSMSSNQSLLSQIVDYVTAGKLPTWESADSKTSLPDNLPVPSDLLSQITETLDAAARRPPSLQSNDSEELPTRADSDEAKKVLLAVLRHLSRVLPAAFVHFAGEETSREQRVKGVKAAEMISTTLSILHLPNFLREPQQYSLAALLSRTTGIHSYCQAATNGFGLALLGLTRKLRIKFEPRSFDFHSHTTYQWSHVGVKGNSPPPAALSTAIKEFYQNQTASLGRASKIIETASSKAREADKEEEDPSEEESQRKELEESTDVNDAYRPTEILSCRQKRLIEAGRRAAEGRKEAPRDKPLGFNQLANLYPAERVEYYRSKNPESKFLESFVGHPYFSRVEGEKDSNGFDK